MLDRRSTGIDLIYRGSAKRFSFYTYAQLIFHNINLGGFVKEIKGTSFWFLYAKKDDFVFLNLMPTLLMLRGVVRILESVVSSRGKMMFVNNDLDLFWGAMYVAMETAEPFCVSRWVGGTLTNFKKLWLYFNRFLQYEKWNALTQPSARLKFSLQGFAYLSAPPSLIFINSLKYSMNVANEAHAVFIPAISLVDIDTNSGDSAYLIPSNDDSEISVDFFNKLFGQIILVNKFRLAKKFIAKKIRRADTFLNKKAMSFWERMFVFREKYEEMHTKSFRLCLRNWIALSGFRRTFAGLFVHNFLNKKIEGFVFRCLRNKRYFHFKKLRTLRVLKNKAKHLYFKYYKNFFFIKNNHLNLKYSLQLQQVTLQLQWFLNILNKLFRIQKWLRVRYEYCQKADLFNGAEKIKTLLVFVTQQYKNTYISYNVFLQKKYYPLRNILRVLNKKNKLHEMYSTLSADNIIKDSSKNMVRGTSDVSRYNTFDKKNKSFRKANISDSLKKKQYSSRDDEIISWDMLFRRTPEINRNIQDSHNIMADLRKKYKGIRYWIEVFKARPWLTVKKPTFLLNYPANFKSVELDRFIVKKFVRADFIKFHKKSIRIQQTNVSDNDLLVSYFKEPVSLTSEDLKADIEAFNMNSTPVAFMELIPKELRVYYHYIDFKVNPSLWYKWFLSLKHYSKEERISENSILPAKSKMLLDFLRYKTVDTSTDKAQDLKEKQIDNLVMLSSRLSQIQIKRWFLKYITRVQAFSLFKTSFTFDWNTFLFSKSLFKDGISPKKLKFLKERAVWYDVQSKYINSFYKLGLAFSKLHRKNENLLFLKNNDGLFPDNLSMLMNFNNSAYNIKNYIRYPLYLRTFFNSKVDRLARLQSNLFVKLNKRNFRKTSQKLSSGVYKHKQGAPLSKRNNFDLRKKRSRQTTSKLFRGFHWIQWLGNDLKKTESFVLNKIVNKYVFLAKKLRFLKKKQKWNISYNQLAFLLHRCFIFILLKGLFISSRRNRRIFRQAMSENLFKYSIHQYFFNTRFIFRLFYKLKKKKARWASFSRAFFSNKAFMFLYPFAKKDFIDPFVAASRISTNRFFYKSVQNCYKTSVFSKLYNHADNKWSRKLRWSSRYSGIPSRRASFFRMLETSKFKIRKKRKLVLKANKRVFGKTLLETYLKDFQFGRAKGSKHYFLVKEILARLQLIKYKKWVVFMQMLKGNKLVSKPFIRSDIDKFSHPKIFLLRNFGTKKFRRIKRQETQDKVSFIKWYANQQRNSRTFPGRMNTAYIIRLWTNKSMFFTY